MTQRPGESAQGWYERAIVNASIAAGLQENYPYNVNLNPAAFKAITQRVEHTAADLDQARTALLAERQAGLSNANADHNVVLPALPQSK